MRTAGGRATVGELRDTARAQLALLRVQLRLWTRAVGALVADAAPPVQADAAALSRATTERATAVRLDRAIDRAARRGLFRPTCLVRSLALIDLLNRAGVNGAVIRLGVRTGTGTARSGALEAHAWVELGDLVLGDHAGQAARFTRLGALCAVDGG